MPHVRPTEAVIELGAVVANYRLAVELGRKPGIAVVKANAYGHGAIPVARALVEAGAPMLGVALVEEGVELRETGISVPILVIGGAYADFDLLVRYQLRPLVFSAAHLEEGAAAARRAGVSLPVHIKVDTGMGRLGLPVEALPGLIDLARRHPEIVVEGACTHYANSGDLELVARQRALFRRALDMLAAAGLPIRFRHIANSGALLNRAVWPEEDCSRPGLMLYGYAPFPPEPGSDAARAAARLKKALTWRTRIVHLKEVPAGTPISYAGRWVSKAPSRIATLPVGYVDGLDRFLTGSDAPGFANGQVLCGGRRVPIVGTVCMDLCMIDVTGVPGAAVGSEVVLLGRQGEECIDADELAGLTGTVSLQVLCGIGPRVPRLYAEALPGQEGRGAHPMIAAPPPASSA
jgi:alanine racemase